MIAYANHLGERRPQRIQRVTFDYMAPLPTMLPENALVVLTEGLTDFIARHEAEKREAIEHRDKIVKKCNDSKRLTSTPEKVLLAHETALRWNSILTLLAEANYSSYKISNDLDMKRGTVESILSGLRKSGKVKKVGTEWVAA